MKTLSPKGAQFDQGEENVRERGETRGADLRRSEGG